MGTKGLEKQSAVNSEVPVEDETHKRWALELEPQLQIDTDVFSFQRAL